MPRPSKRRKALVALAQAGRDHQRILKRKADELLEAPHKIEDKCPDSDSDSESELEGGPDEELEGGPDEELTVEGNALMLLMGSNEDHHLKYVRGPQQSRCTIWRNQQAKTQLRQAANSTRSITNYFKPTTSEPVLSEPTTSEPVLSEPTTGKPATGKPATAEPTTGKPTTGKPATGKPATAEPTTAEPATSEPVLSEPATAEPATAEPSA